MDLALAAVAEQLAQEFADLPGSTVVREVTASADQFPLDDDHFIAQAARARLTAILALDHTTLAGHRDSLHVSLHDGELHEEVQLTVHLIIAANESDRPLSQAHVDELLGITTHHRHHED